MTVRVQGVTVYILDKMKLGDVSTARVTWGSSTGRCCGELELVMIT